MPLPVGAQTGTGNTKTADGTPGNPLRQGGQNDLIVSELHGKFYEQTYRKNVFVSANQALTTTTVGLSTTYTGFCLSNPIGSSVNLSLIRATMMQSVVQSAQIEAFALAYGYSATTNVVHTTAVTTRPTFIGATNNSTGLTDAAATLPVAPTYGDFLTNTSSATTMNGGGFYQLDGSVILQPGAFAIFATPAQASVGGMWFGFVWEEVLL